MCHHGFSLCDQVVSLCVTICDGHMEHHATFDFHKVRDVPGDIAARLVDQFSTVAGLCIDASAAPMFEAFLAVMRLPLKAGIRTAEVGAIAVCGVC